MGFQASAAALSCVSAAGVYFDATLFGLKRGYPDGFPGLVPWSWALVTLVFWPVLLPWYIGLRVRLTYSPTFRERYRRNSEIRRAPIVIDDRHDAQT